jgi:beta-xylosidase
MQKTYTNPVWNADFPDPHVIAWKGRYFAYATETAKHGSGFQVMESVDLVRWTHRGTCFTPPWSREHLWAPEVIHRKNRLWLTYSALDPRTKKHAIGIAVSDTPTGPFVHQAILVTGESDKVGVIDTTIQIEKDGTAWLLYSAEEPRRIVMQKLTDDFTRCLGEPIELIRPTEPWERGVTEAPTIVVRDGKYHLFYSSGWFESTKKEASYCVAHAVSGALAGPYKKTGAILASLPGRIWGPGHQCVLRVGKTDWLFYHGWSDENEPRYGSNPSGRTLRVDKLLWRDGIPQPLAPSTTPTPL